MVIDFQEVEVLSVFTAREDDNSNYSILGRFVGLYSNKSSVNPIVFKPLDPNNLQLPVVHEVVMGCKVDGVNYYTNKISKLNSPSVSPEVGKSQFLAKRENVDIKYGDYFVVNPSGSKSLIPFEGDTIIQGRFGNSIRLGSNQYSDFDTDELKVKDNREFINSPNIKLVSGISNYPVDDEGKDLRKSYLENIKNELSSIYLTTNEPTIIDTYKFDEITYAGNPNVIIQSDKIVFNAKDKINFWSSNINLGDSFLNLNFGNETNLEPMVLGNTLKTLLKDILDIIENTIIGAGNTTLAAPYKNKFTEVRQTLEDEDEGILSKFAKIRGNKNDDEV